MHTLLQLRVKLLETYKSSKCTNMRVRCAIIYWICNIQNSALNHFCSRDFRDHFNLNHSFHLVIYFMGGGITKNKIIHILLRQRISLILIIWRLKSFILIIVQIYEAIVSLPVWSLERKLRARKPIGWELFPNYPDTAIDRWGTLKIDWYAYIEPEHYPSWLVRSGYSTVLAIKQKTPWVSFAGLVRYSVWQRRNWERLYGQVVAFKRHSKGKVNSRSAPSRNRAYEGLELSGSILREKLKVHRQCLNFTAVSLPRRELQHN